MTQALASEAPWIALELWALCNAIWRRIVAFGRELVDLAKRMIDELERRRLELFNRRQMAWRRMFCADQWKPAAGFNSDASHVVGDLTRLCYGLNTTIRYDSAGRVDEVATAYAEGQRTVLLMILSKINMPLADFAEAMRQRQEEDERAIG